MNHERSNPESDGKLKADSRNAVLELRSPGQSFRFAFGVRFSFLGFIAFLIACAGAVLLHSQPAETNRVLELDGNGSYLTLPADLLQGAEEVTVEGWVKWERLGGWSRFIDFGASHYGFHVAQVEASSTLKLGWAYESRLNGGNLNVPNLVRTNEWCHLAAVAGKSGMKLYFNGHLVASASIGGTVPVPSGVSNFVGKSQWQANAHFAGQIDEIRVWNLERSAEQIRDGLKHRVNRDEPGLIACWSFDLDDGSVATPGGQRAVLIGSARYVEAPAPTDTSFAQPARIRGRVLLENGQPASGAVIRLQQDGTILNETAAGTRGDQNGVYDLVLFHPNEKPYELVAVFAQRTLLRPNVRLNPEQALDLNLTFQDSGGIAGTLRMFDGTPHVAVVVNAMGRRGEIAATAVSDESGNYRLTNLKPGDYQVRCHVLGGFEYAAGPGESVFVAATTGRPEPGISGAHAIAVQPGRVSEKIDFRFAPFKKGTWRSYSVIDGLSVPIVYALTEDESGMIWATGFGEISRFDGKRFESFNTQPALWGPVSKAHRGPDGTIWFGGQSTVLKRFNGSSFELDVQLPDPVEQFVWALESDATGLLWIGTNKGLWFFDGSSFFSCENEHPLSKLQVTSLYRAADQSIWVGTASGLFRVRRTDLAGSRGERVIQLLAPNNVDRFTTSDGLLDDHIRAITGNGDGPIWIGTANGLSRYDGTRFRNLTLRDGLPAPAVTALAVDSDGSVWMGFSTGMRLGRGIARYDGSTLINYTIADGMPNDAVTGLHFGRDGVLWIGTDGGGVMAYDPETFVNFAVRDGLPNNYVGKVSTDPNGGVWISAGWRFVFEGGLFRVATPVTPAGAHRLENYGERIGLPRRFWHSIVTDAHGALWFQGPKANVHRYDGTRLTELPHQSGALAVGREGTVWSLAASGLARFDGKEFVAVPNTFDTPLATSALLVTRDGDCWFALNRSGHPDALIRFDGTSYSTPLARQQVWLSAVAFSEADDGSIWVAGWTGIGRFSGTTLEMIATEKALPHASVEAAYAAPDGSIWIGTTGGLARYDGSAWSLIDVRDGLPSTETLSIAAAPDGAIWVGTSAGACRFQPNKVAPVARIISVQSEASHTNLDRLPDFRTGNRLTLRFDSIDLKTVPAKRQFRSAVFGGNAGPNERFNWLSPSSDMQFEWTPERPGTYTFAVQAIDRDLNYSTPALLTLNVVTPWYANTWVLYAGGAAFTLSAGIALLSTLRSRQRKLEAQHLRERLLLEERKAREAAESAKNAADEANQAKSQFLASMSHELRTPLNAIIGYSEIVQEELTDLGVKEVIPDLQKINAAARHQLGLVNDILDLSKIEAGKMTLFIEEFDVSKLVNEVASTIQPLVAKNSNNLVVDCPADIGTMRTDQTKLRQTLFNLLSNACKFTERGVITLRVQSEISNLRFEITDTGIGMTPEQITKLFQAFTQADASTSKKYGGTGLGLALSKKFCQMMHGELSLTSDYGKGSTFTVLLPAKVSAGKT